ncbi:MAG: hypothetical protein H0X45_07130 [Planctomycetes bacterium]|nr:hypothetical protein [Planctomycetota bacterium]
MRVTTICAFLVFTAAALGAADETRLLCSFEDDADLGHWEAAQASAEANDLHATHGRRSLRIAANEYVKTTSLPGIAPGDWAAYDSLEIDVFVAGSSPVGLSVLVGDEAWTGNRTYWNRHNGNYTVTPGANTLSIPVKGLYRGEAGCRNIDIRSNIDPARIVRLDLGFGGDAGTSLWLDHIRLSRGEARPEGILAFDFGPASQTEFPGFAPIAYTTVHGRDGATAGLTRQPHNANRARDDTFPTRLYQDWIDFTVDGDGNTFVVDVPNGTWHGWLVYSDCGYWGGETAQFRRRAIVVEGAEVSVEDRGDAGPDDPLYRFERVEPTPGCDVWDLYIAKIFAPHRFSAEIRDGRLDLGIAVDGSWNAKVAALILYPDARKAEAEAWIADVVARNRDEALSRAVCMGPVPKPLAVPEDAAAKGWWLGAPGLSEVVTFVDAPGAPIERLERVAARGQRVATTFAVRPLKDFPVAALTVSDLTGPDGAIPAARVDLRYAHNALWRNFHGVAYSMRPVGLRPVAGGGVALGKELTRQFWVTVEVPADAKPGRYAGELTLSAGALKQAIPLVIDVLDLALDEVAYPRGFFSAGDMAVWTDGGAAMREVFSLYTRHGMNTFSGGPDIAFDGFDAAGQPKLDFAPLEALFRVAKECGMGDEVFRYGSLGWVPGLYDGPHRQAWEASGKPFADLLAVVWGAVDARAKAAGWPKINYGMIDEPRALEHARELREFLQLHRDAVPALRIGGFYSVDWSHSDDPLHHEIQEIFRTVTWSAMGASGPADFEQAKASGRELYLYNQGADRPTHGAYTWARMNQGARGMLNWNAFSVSAYQFFDLDGREPDFAMMELTTSGINPTLWLARSAEGVSDLRFAATLQRVATAAGAKPEATEALAWLRSIVDGMPPGSRELPPSIAGDDAFRDGCIARLRTLSAR